MHIPKVKFEIAPIEETIHIISQFINTENKDFDWSDAIFKEYPTLKRSEKDSFFLDFFDKERDTIEKKVSDFQSNWNQINDDLMIALSEIMEIKWNPKDKEIKGRLSMSPMVPPISTITMS